MTAHLIAHSPRQFSPRIALVVLAIMVAGCAQDGSLTGISTAAIDPQKQVKADPQCVTLTAQIEELNKDGIPEKVSKAAQKKYKMKAADFAKADELNKANAEFQAKCSDYPPAANVAVAPEPAASTAAAGTQVAKAKPPVPSPKPVSASLAAQTTPGQQTTGSIATTEPPQP